MEAAVAFGNAAIAYVRLAITRPALFMRYDQLLHELNRLQRRIYESYREYNTTQDNLDSERLKDHFYQQAAQRKHFYEDIRERIKSLDEIPDDVTRPFGDAADEIFTDLKTLFSNEDDRLILQEVKMVEQKLVRAYDQVLEVAALAPQLRGVLESQRAEVERDYEMAARELARFDGRD